MADEARRFVVTGAGGSIGSHLCEKIVTSNAESLKLISLTESGLYNVERRLRSLQSDTKLTGILGSVCDYGLMCEVCEDTDVVIHAAAHKHVPICEANPITAIENNIRGTYRLSDAADSAKVGQFIFVSTDKAVRPKSVMGMTKRVGEMIVADRAAKSKQTIFTTVRFGNVLDSAGSVMPLWREQIGQGGPITITDERCERYFMSIPEACELIFGVLEMKKPGTFVFDMGEPTKLIDIAKKLIKDGGSKCEINCIGLRPGEKLTEELHFDGELLPTSHPKIFEVERNGKSPRMAAVYAVLLAASCRNEELALSDLRDMTC